MIGDLSIPDQEICSNQDTHYFGAFLEAIYKTESSCFESTPFLSFWTAFLTAVMSNPMLSLDRFLSLASEFSDSCGFQALLVGIFLIVLSAYLFHIGNKNEKAITFLFIADVFAIAVVFAPIFLPFKGLRVCVAWYTFACFMSLHQFILGFGETNLSFFELLLSVFTLGMYKRNCHEHLQRHKLLKLGGYFIANFFLCDFNLFITKEWVVHYVTDKISQQFAISFFTGLWVVGMMELTYTINEMVFCCFACPFPEELKHRRPITSTSLSEFWGSRWNPVIGKLLKNAFYKPARRYGVARFWCVVLCFLGSAMLHGIPQHFGNHDFCDSVLIALFFIVHGFLVLVEHLFLQLVGFGPAPPPKALKQRDLCKAGRPLACLVTKENSCCLASNLHFVEWIGEKLILVFNSGLVLLVCLKKYPSTKTALLIFSVGLFGSLCVVSSRWERSTGEGGNAEIYAGNESEKKEHTLSFSSSLRKCLLMILGNCWTVSILMVTLPLFGLPIHHAFEKMYPCSMLVGPLVQAYQSISCR